MSDLKRIQQRRYNQSMNAFFQGGILILDGVPHEAEVPPVFRWIKGRWRCEGYRYPLIQDWLRQNGIDDNIPRWRRLDLALHDQREAHDYQIEALDTWAGAGHRGSIVLPTGAGKTFVAIRAVQQVNRSALVVAPTIDLLHQWYACLENTFQTPIGVYYGGEKIIQPITVTTYHSAGDLIAEHGNTFKLVIYDEVHHLPAPSWGETALMTPAPFRLGLTATYPEDHEQAAGRWRVDELIGPIVYQKRIDDLVGQRLAEYRTERVRVDLTAEERDRYDADYAIYAGFFRSRELLRTHGPNWLMELMRLSAFDREARRALLARQRIQRLLATAQNKLNLLDGLLREHAHESVLIFTEHNAAVYEISRRYLVPSLTHETKAAERKQVLEAFRDGHYPVLVTSKVLNEGVDVPEAKVAIVLGGTASAREYIQRLGRVLRKIGNRRALLLEVIVRNTVDEGKAQRRRKART
jgi:superfamily II DNA or RNA helicase